MNGNSKVGLPHSEWDDVIVDWCRASLQALSDHDTDKKQVITDAEPSF